MSSENIIIEKLEMLYSFINRELFYGKMPSAKILLSNQGLNSKRTVNTQFVRYDKGLYVIKISKMVLNQPWALISFFMQQMVHVYCIENGLLAPNSRYFNVKFLEICEKYELKTVYDQKNGYLVKDVNRKKYKRYVDFLFTDDWNNHVRIVRNRGVVYLSKKDAEKMNYFICPECKLLVNAPKDSFIKCGTCNMTMMEVNHYIDSYDN